MDFYKKLDQYKEANKLGNREIGAFIGLTADAMRMAINRKSLKPLQIKEIEKMFALKKENKPTNIDPMEMIRIQNETIETKSKLIEAHEDKIKSKDLEIQKLKKELEDCKRDIFFKNKPVQRNS